VNPGKTRVDDILPRGIRQAHKQKLHLSAAAGQPEDMPAGRSPAKAGFSALRYTGRVQRQGVCRICFAPPGARVTARWRRGNQGH
jgi:hypothetical protein